MEAVSYTAQWTAAARALETERPDPIFCDPWARTVAGDVGFTLLERYAGAGTAQFVVVRTKYVDSVIAKLPIRQVVLLAAGMDTRAARLDWPDGAALFELDLPALFEAKALVLPPTIYRPGCQHSTVDVDLAGEWMGSVLDAGLDATQSALWVAEGLFFFLPEDAVRRLLTIICQVAAPGTVLVGDFISKAALHNPMARSFLRLLEDDGTPWRFGTDDPAAFLLQTGWRVTDLKQPGEEGADFARWPYPVPAAAMMQAPRSFMFTAEVL